MTDAVLELQGLSKAFGALQATRDVSLNVLQGEVHALIGPNGAGKSTLIAQIAGSLTPDDGAVRFLGQDVTHLPVAARARLGLGRSFQISATIPEATVLENVLLARVGRKRLGLWAAVLRPSEDRAAAEAVLRRVGLWDARRVVAAALSHGERRKLELAMALALEPRIFLLDEPMAGLDEAGTAEMTTLLDALRHQAPILLIEHDMDVVFRLADRITVLEYGQVLATGTAQEIRAHPDVRRAYLGEVA